MDSPNPYKAPESDDRDAKLGRLPRNILIGMFVVHVLIAGSQAVANDLSNDSIFVLVVLWLVAWIAIPFSLAVAFLRGHLWALYVLVLLSLSRSLAYISYAHWLISTVEFSPDTYFLLAFALPWALGMVFYLSAGIYLFCSKSVRELCDAGKQRRELTG